MKLFKEVNYKIQKMFNKHAEKLELDMICDHVKDEVSKMNLTLSNDVKKVAEFSLKIDELADLIKVKNDELKAAEQIYANIITEIKKKQIRGENVDDLKSQAIVNLKNIAFLEKTINDLKNTEKTLKEEYENMIVMLRNLKMKIIDKNLEAEQAIVKYNLNKLKKSVENEFKLESSILSENKSYCKKLNDQIKMDETTDKINEKIGNNTFIIVNDIIDDSELESRLNQDLAI